MRAERPKVPGCSCFRIFLSSEISLVLVWGSGKNVLRMEGLAIQGLGPDSGVSEEPWLSPELTGAEASTTGACKESSAEHTCRKARPKD